eukprot:CAMPEP_0198290916 /NCGR_PEP_ID=MMETSP1449-20131203/8611_1 /TAXON_ID=420275 /ORGANISM="Attheya septentrionalis, Strain CCMP2084" /LENGTH=132 /DNA_ID=CAMNT_0043989479 /DNA_START=83 /DNA_END=481 /DNA_ORIENTATION=-
MNTATLWPLRSKSETFTFDSPVVPRSSWDAIMSPPRIKSTRPNIEVEDVPSFLHVPVDHVPFSEKRETFPRPVTPSSKSQKHHIEYACYIPRCSNVCIRQKMAKRIKLNQKSRQPTQRSTLDDLNHLLIPEY